MAQLTPNLGLTKPEMTDALSPVPLSGNFDIIDEAFKELKNGNGLAVVTQEKWETLTNEEKGRVILIIRGGTSRPDTTFVTVSALPKFTNLTIAPANWDADTRTYTATIANYDKTKQYCKVAPADYASQGVWGGSAVFVSDSSENGKIIFTCNDDVPTESLNVVVEVGGMNGSN